LTTRTATAKGADALLTVIGSLYDAALDERLWPDVLRQLNRLTDSQAASFWVMDGPRLTTFLWIGFDHRAVNEYLSGMANLDPTVRYLLAHPGHSIVHDGLLGTAPDEDTRCYTAWHERNIETRYRLVGQSDLGPGLQAGVALHRARRVGRYEPRDVARFTRLHEHLRRALTVGVRLGSVTSRQQVGMDLLDRSATAIVLLDAQGRVVYLNRAAEALQSRCDDLSLHAHGIRLADESDHERLQALIRQCIDAVTKSGRSTGAVMRAIRPSGRRPYSIRVSGIAHAPPTLTLFRPVVSLLISDPERRPGPSAQEVTALFRLTPAEVRLAQSLADGTSLRRSADRLGITYGSARSRLTQIFDKTHTRSQRELIRLLLTVVAAD
jgi:DNA-binding CsgD family transcriptional regulator/PAS domain-containing protein